MGEWLVQRRFDLQGKMEVQLGGLIWDIFPAPGATPGERRRMLFLLAFPPQAQ